MRTTNRILATLLAFALLALGLLLVAQTTSGLTGRAWPVPWRWRVDLAGTTVANPWFLAASVLTGAIGLALVIGQLVPRRQRHVPIQARERVWWLARGSVERRIERAAAARSGLARARVSVHGDSHRWRVTVTGQAPDHRRAAVERTVRQELRTMGAPTELDMSVSLQHSGRLS